MKKESEKKPEKKVKRKAMSRQERDLKEGRKPQIPPARKSKAKQAKIVQEVVEVEAESSEAEAEAEAEDLAEVDLKAGNIGDVQGVNSVNTADSKKVTTLQQEGMTQASRIKAKKEQDKKAKAAKAKRAKKPKK